MTNLILGLALGSPCITGGGAFNITLNGEPVLLNGENVTLRG